jgi:hypothetical protein
MGGKLGDFLHSMYAVKHLTKLHNTKAHIHLYDIGWELGIETAHRELSELMLRQDYVESVSILTDYELGTEFNSPVRVYNKKLLDEGFFDLGDYIRSPWLYKACWTELYSNTFQFPITSEYAWIEHNKIDERLVNKILIHRRYNPIRLNPLFPYEQIINEYGEHLVFVASSDKDYEAFPYKDVIPFVKVSLLDDWFTAVNSCFMFISNLSSPTAMAHALDKLRIIELPNTEDIMHCVGEEKYSSNIRWYLNDTFNNLR